MVVKKVGRPTDSKKDNLLRVRIDQDTLNILDNIVNKKSQNRSEVIRDIIHIISSKDFENMISLGTLEKLEQYSIQCSKYFENPHLKIELEDISINFPAFIFKDTKPPILYIKYPTYKIRILLPNNSAEVKGKIESLLQDVDGISEIYETQCNIITKSNINKVFLPEVMCLKSTLKDNTLLKDDICSILNDNSIDNEVWPAYSIIGKKVKMISEDGTSYIVNI